MPEAAWWVASIHERSVFDRAMDGKTMLMAKGLLVRTDDEQTSFWSSLPLHEKNFLLTWLSEKDFSGNGVLASEVWMRWMIADMTRLAGDAQMSRWSKFPFRAKEKLLTWLGEREYSGNEVLERKVWMRWMMADMTEKLFDTHLTGPDEQDRRRLLDRMAATFNGVFRQDRPEVQFAQGAAVTIDGLNRCTEYNGQRGIISSNLLDGRYEVWVESARTTVKIRPRNLLEVNVKGEGKRAQEDARGGPKRM